MEGKLGLEDFILSPLRNRTTLRMALKGNSASLPSFQVRELWIKFNWCTSDPISEIARL